MSVLDPFQLTIGFDTEYVRVSEKDNRIVSYQFALYNPRSGKRASGLITPSGPRHNHRYSFGGCLGRVLAFAERNGFPDTVDGRLPSKTRILVVAHFSRADLPAFRDFRRLKRRFTLLRGTYATTERPAIFDVQVMHGCRRRISVTLCDTRLIAPASAGSIKALGELLGFPELSVPDVVDERGNQIDGILRMDLVAIQHPTQFRAYAVRDAEIAVEWLLRFTSFADQWKLPKLTPTIAAMAVAMLRSFADPQLPLILGKKLNKRGRLGDEFLQEALDIQGTVADTYHGGRNECYQSGLHRAVSTSRPFLDLDFKSAYVTAMAPTRAVDWADIKRTTDVEKLAVLDALTVAAVDFEFPPDTRFPSLAVHDRKHGLIYSLKGSAHAIGPELIVALNQGAHLRVRTGIVIPWLDKVAGETDLPFIEFARIIKATRESFKKGSIEELMAKEAGNSLYGKTAQAVGNMKTVPEGQRIFDTRDGASKPLPPSKITSPLIAAYTSGLPRAVLSEILGNLPDHVRVLSATTDGWLADCTMAEARAAASGPVARYFAEWAGRIDPNCSTEIIEVKHRAAAVIVARTRHAVTVELAAQQGDRIDHAYLRAKGSHHLEREFEFNPDDDESKRAATREEAAELIELWRNHIYETKLPQRNFISPRDQWQSDADLTDKVRYVRVALDYDFKREPVDVVEIEGFLNFNTRPWTDVDAFQAARDDLDGWIATRKSVLKSMSDWIDFQAWSGSPSMRSAGNRTPCQQAWLVAWAQGRPGFPIRVGPGRIKTEEPTLAEVADILIDAGVPDVTRNVLMHARRRAPDPIGSVVVLTETDRNTRQALRSHLSDEALDSVLAEVQEKAVGNRGKNRQKQAPKRRLQSEPANTL